MTIKRLIYTILTPIKYNCGLLFEESSSMNGYRKRTYLHARAARVNALRSAMPAPKPTFVNASPTFAMNVPFPYSNKEKHAMPCAVVQSKPSLQIFQTFERINANHGIAPANSKLYRKNRSWAISDRLLVCVVHWSGASRYRNAGASCHATGGDGLTELREPMLYRNDEATSSISLIAHHCSISGT